MNKSEIQIDINREYAKRVGLSTGQIAQSIRTSLFGKDVSTYNFKTKIMTSTLGIAKES